MKRTHALPDVNTSGESLASNTVSSDQGRIHRIVVTAGIVAVLTFVVVILRFYRLSDMPPGIQNDEGPDGVYALQVLQGDYAVFFPEKGSGRDAVGVYANALSTAILGRTLLAFHLPVALASGATVFAVFWLGQVLFGREEESSGVNRWRGLLIGGVGAGLLAVSIGQTLQSRAGLRAAYLPLFLSLSLALLWLGWRKRSLWMIALAGVCTGLLAYTYNAARFVPFLLLFFGISLLLPFGQLAKNRVRHAVRPASVFLGTSFLVAAPLLIYFAVNPDDFFIRSKGVWLFNDIQGNPLAIFLKNVWEYLLVFGFHGDRNSRYNFGGHPMLNILEAFFFWIGVVAALGKWRRSPQHRILPIWLIVLLLPAMLTRDDGYGPNSLRMIGATPAIYMLIGVGLWETFLLLRERSRVLPWLATILQGKNEVSAAVAVLLVVCTWVLAQGAITHRTFFQKWAGTPEYFRTYQTEWADAARELSSKSSDAGTVNFLPYPTSREHFQNAHYGFEYLYHSAAQAHVIAATNPHNLAQKVEAKLADEQSVSTVRFVDWNNDIVGGDALTERHTIALLGKFGRYLESSKHERFQIHTFTDISLDQRWTLYDRIEPLTVHFDGGISLLGFALGQGMEQLSMHQQLVNVQGSTWWIALQWQTAPEQEVVYSVSLRLHDDDGKALYQSDAVLENSTPVATDKWKSDEPVDTLHFLEFPPELPPGEYELRLVVYDFETLKPTVELGVWEAEKTLARLKVGEFE